MKQGTNSANFMKIMQGSRLQSVYILKFGQISVKFSVLGVLYPYHCALRRWGRNLAWRKESTPNCTPIGATFRPCRGKILKITLWV